MKDAKTKQIKPLPKDSLKVGDIVLLQSNCSGFEPNVKYTLMIYSETTCVYGPAYEVYIVNENRFEIFHHCWFYGWEYYEKLSNIINDYHTEVLYIEKI